MTRRPAPPSSSSPFAIDVQPQESASFLEKTRRTKRGDGLAGRSHKSTTPPNGRGEATDLVASFIEKVRKTKRSGDDFTRRSHKSIRDLNGSGKTTESMALLGDLHEENWTDDDFARSLQSIRGGNGSGKITQSMALGDLHGDSNRYDWLNRTSLQKETYLPSSKSLNVARFGSRSARDKLNGHSKVHRPIHRDDVTSGYCRDLESLGYPVPQIDHDGMILINSFEDTFGDAYPEGVWHEFNRTASSDIHRYVVALASFKGGKRHFACTGFFIEWNGSTTILTSASLVRNSSDENKADEDLRIEVLLPNKHCIKGMLTHYSLHYNVALVGVRDFRVVRPAAIQPCRFGSSKVAAIGRCFISDTLMATSGRLVSWSGTLDCRYTVRSSCKITKAGIGGSLVNMLNGKVIGMNFYDTRIGTPFLLWEDIDNILTHFMEKSKLAGREDCDPSGAHFWKMEGDDSDRPSRWPVPEPCWLHPDDLAEDESEDDDELGIEYGYSHGRKVVLL